MARPKKPFRQAIIVVGKNFETAVRRSKVGSVTMGKLSKWPSNSTHHRFLQQARDAGLKFKVKNTSRGVTTIELRDAPHNEPVEMTYRGSHGGYGPNVPIKVSV
jgi:hypothetical protein